MVTSVAEKSQVASVVEVNVRAGQPVKVRTVQQFEHIKGHVFKKSDPVDLIAAVVAGDLPDYQDSLDEFRAAINAQLALRTKEVDESVSGFSRRWTELVHNDRDLMANLDVRGEHIPVRIFGWKDLGSIRAYWVALIDDVVIVSRGNGQYSNVVTYSIGLDPLERAKGGT